MPNIFNKTKLKVVDLGLSPRQLESLNLHLKANGRVYLWTKNGKTRIISADEITVLEGIV